MERCTRHWEHDPKCADCRVYRAALRAFIRETLDLVEQIEAHQS